MSIEQLFTLTTALPGQQKAAGHSALSGSPIPPGMGFLDFILAQLAQNETGEEATDEQSGQDKETGVLKSDNPLLAENPELNLAQILAENPEIAEEIENFSLDQQTALSETLALNQHAFDQILKPIVKGQITIENVEQVITEALQNGKTTPITETFLIDTESAEIEFEKSALNKLAVILNKIEGLITADSPAPAFVATNLTPEQITNLKQQVEKILAGETQASDQTGDENLTGYEGILIGLIKILPPRPETSQSQNRPDAIIKPALIQGVSQDSAASPANITPELAARLNNITPGGNEQPATLAKLPEPFTGTNGENTDFEQALNNIGNKNVKAKTAEALIANTETSQKPSVTPNANILQSWPFTLTGSLFTPVDWTQDGSYVGQINSITSTANLTSLVTQSTHASQPHPATQMVAASIQKSISNGESRNILLQLDPPELGKVDIQMNFAKDKTVKVSVTAEKPETFMMLQRDAHMLERVLENAGLDAEGNLSFELAQEGYEFGQNGGHDNHAGGQGSNDNAEEDNVIETTMTWHVDPETGHMRYDLLA